MASSKKKPPPSDFDFDAFLNSDQSGMQTAVRAMLHRDPQPSPGINLIPDLSLIPAATLIPGSSLSPGRSSEERMPESELDSPSTIPGLNLIPGPSLTAGLALKRRFPIRQMRLAQDAHSRAEQAVYQKLWETAKPFDDVSRLITIGFGEMGRLVGLSESNARINTRMLIRKLAMEEHAGYDCEHGTGRTYRVFSYQEILNRRKKAGLTRYQRRTLAVVFVDDDGQPINLANARPGINLQGEGDSKLGGGAGPNLGARPGINLGPLYREQLREQETSSSVSLIVRTVQAELGAIDDAAARRILESCREKAPDVTDEELEHFARLQASRVRNSKRVENPIGLLIAQIPKCFEGESFRQFRKAKQRQGREAALEDPVDERRYRAIVDDPNASELEKRLALAVLAGAPGGQ
jgi:hypothetical protein